MTVQGCSSPQYTPTAIVTQAENQLDPIDEATIRWRKTLTINGEAKECTLFLYQNQIHLRVGNREYAVCGTPMSVPVPGTSQSIEVLIPFSRQNVESADCNSTIDCEEGLIGASIKIPDLLEGEMIIDESTLPESLASLERAADGNLVIIVMHGNLDIQNPSDSNITYRMEYNQSRCVLRLQEIHPEIR